MSDLADSDIVVMLHDYYSVVKRGDVDMVVMAGLWVVG